MEDAQTEITGDGNAVGDHNSPMIVKLGSGSPETVIQVAGDYHAPSPTKRHGTIQRVSEILAKVARHWVPLMSLLTLEVILWVVYLILRDRYLVSLVPWLVAMLAALMMVVGLSVLSRNFWKGWKLRLFCGISGALLLSLLGWQAWGILQPPKTDPDDFAIVVALIGEGQDFHVTPISRDVTDQIFRGLDAAVDKTPDWKGVSVRRIGLVTNSQEAETQGRRYGASLIVWGQLIDLGTGSKTLTVEYELLRIPDRVHYPAYPIVLPVTSVLASGNSELRLDEIGKRSLAIRDIEAVIAASLGLAAYYSRDYGTAVQRFEHAANARGTNDHQSNLIAFYLGRAYQHLGEIEIGNAWLQRAGDSVPQDPSIPLSIALGYRSLGQQDQTKQQALKAKELASTQLKRRPDDLIAKYDLGLIYGLLQEPEMAVEVFDAILRTDPTFYVAYLSAGQGYLQLDKVDAAIERFSSAINLAREQGMDSSWAHVFLADAYLIAGDDQKAGELYQQAAELAPSVDWMHFAQGKFFEDRGQADLAQHSYQRLLETSLDKPWAHTVRGAFFRQQGDYKQAIQEYKAAISERPSDVLSQVYLAELYLETGEERKAIQTHEDAIRKAPEMGYAYASYASSLAKLGKCQEAVPLFEKSIKLQPDDCASQSNLVRCLDAIGESSKATTLRQELVDQSGSQCRDTFLDRRSEDAASEDRSTTPQPISTLVAPIAPRLTSNPSEDHSITPLPTPTTMAPATPRPTSNPIAQGAKPPGHACPTIYTVRYGETLYGIAAQCGTSAATIMRVNGLRSSRVWPGQRLYMPAPKGVPAPQPTPGIRRAPAP